MMSSGREAQRRRTRKAIVEAAAKLSAGGATPSIDEIAAAADVARRTIYSHFPTLDQLLIDATAGAINEPRWSRRWPTPWSRATRRPGWTPSSGRCWSTHRSHFRWGAGDPLDR
ncbi:TetR/AcrR family transcriptional regulator [Nonomuraea dietziae]|uniref:TetR/AcrR family transcriptional regulator n=1 Tax=Nonomuraea dietziae TaxID=65515 RepID=UPI0031E16B11